MILVRTSDGVSIHMGNGIYATVEPGDLLDVPDDSMGAELLDRGGWEIALDEEVDEDAR